MGPKGAASFLPGASMMVAERLKAHFKPFVP
jgi:hypothetical protein